MLGRKTTGSVVCASCGSLVGVNDDKCYSCGRAKPGLWGFAPVLRQLGNDLGFVPVVIGACSIMFLLTVLLGTRFDGSPNIMTANTYALVALGASGSGPVFAGGRWWTVLSASWLHGGLIHILMNMWSIRNLGPSAADLLGPARVIIVYVVAGVCGFLLSSYMGNAITIGASASICGLIGAFVHYGRTSGSRLIYNQAIQWSIGFLVFGFIFPGIDNWAHIGGFAGGYVSSMVLNPLTRERGDHMLIALLCLLASFASLVYSVYSNWTIIFG